MVDYYKVLNVSPKASAVEIKSAYRRLARKLHPDVNGGAETASHDFSRIAKAYQTLSDPVERARYDEKLVKFRNGDSSVLTSSNPHAQRLRRIQIQRRMDAVVDRLIDAERKETLALQRAVFPVVALFISTFFVAMLKPQFWSNSEFLGKMVLLTLFIIGVLHLAGRLRQGFQRYTYNTDKLHDSIFSDEEEERPFSRLTATAFLVSGVAVSFVIGFLIGKYLEILITSMMANAFAPTLRVEMIFYPPIAVLIVDTMHNFASKADF
jgi:hypothetical protein